LFSKKGHRGNKVLIFFLGTNIFVKGVPVEFALLKTTKFEFTGNLYKDKSLFSRIELHAYRGKYRVYYHLPDGSNTYFYSLPKLTNKKEKETFLAEFSFALSSGYLPRSGAKELRKKNFDPKIGTFEVFFEKYFTEYSTGARSKLDESKKNQEGISRNIIKYFKEKNINSICQITDEHLQNWDSDLNLRLKKGTNERLSGGTRNAYRKCFRAFLNTAKERKYPLQCDPEQMNIFEHTKGGDIDEKADVRQIVYPLALIEAVEKCSYPLDLKKEPDIKKIIRLWREVGGRTGEMLSLGESNIEFQNGKPLNLKIQEIPEIKFTPKTEVSKRTIPLTDSSSDYIASIIKEFKGVKRYEKGKNGLVIFPFLFIFKDKNGNWVRDDAKFKKLFKGITKYAIKEFNLPYRENYIPYDLRRSCNQYLRKERGFELSKAAAFLGHSEITNKKHYTLDEDNSDINKIQIHNALMESIRLNPETEKIYSRHFKGEVSKPTPTFCTQDMMIERNSLMHKNEIELSSLQEDLATSFLYDFNTQEKDDLKK